MAKPASLFDSAPADAPAAPGDTVSVDPVTVDRHPATRLRAVLLVALLAVGLADLAVVRQSMPVRTAADPTPTGALPPLITPSAVVTPSLSPPAAAPLPAGPSARDLADVAFVRRYYALLPRDPRAAFRLLGGEARARSGGLGTFTAFYSGIAAVSIEPTPAVVGPSTVAAVIRFRRLDGRTTDERYELVVAAGPGGNRFLASYRRTSVTLR